MVQEFKAFVLRGNIVELAVAVVMGVAFGAVIASLVADIITPIVAAIFGSPDFAGLTFEINGSVFRYGAFLNAVFAFLTVAAAVFFVVVRPLDVIAARRAAEQAATSRACPECLSQIPLEARRCAFCTSDVGGS